MIERILTGWTWIRAVYAFMGAAIIFQAFADKEWLLVIFGAYFASMGVFGFGCAGGNCYGGACDTNVNQKTPSSKIEDTTFEEIKS